VQSRNLAVADEVEDEDDAESDEDLYYFDEEEDLEED